VQLHACSRAAAPCLLPLPTQPPQTPHLPPHTDLPISPNDPTPQVVTEIGFHRRFRDRLHPAVVPLRAVVADQESISLVFDDGGR